MGVFYQQQGCPYQGREDKKTAEGAVRLTSSTSSLPFSHQLTSVSCRCATVHSYWTLLLDSAGLSERTGFGSVSQFIPQMQADDEGIQPAS